MCNGSSVHFTSAAIIGTHTILIHYGHNMHTAAIVRLKAEVKYDRILRKSPFTYFKLVRGFRPYQHNGTTLKAINRKQTGLKLDQKKCHF